MKGVLSKKRVFRMVEEHEISVDEAAKLLKQLNGTRLNHEYVATQPASTTYFHSVWEKSEIKLEATPKLPSGPILVFDTNNDLVGSVCE